MKTIFAAIFTFVFCSMAYAQDSECDCEWLDWRGNGQWEHHNWEWDSHYREDDHGEMITATILVVGEFEFECREDEVVASYAPLPWFHFDPTFRSDTTAELLVLIDDGEVESFVGEFFQLVPGLSIP